MKILSIVLFLSIFFSLTACYSTKYIKAGDDVSQAFRNSKEVDLYSLDESYHFANPANIIFVGDSLYGTGRMLFGGESDSARYVKIALRDIYSLQVTSYDMTKTGILLGAGILAAVFASKPFKIWKRTSSSSFIRFK